MYILLEDVHFTALLAISFVFFFVFLFFYHEVGGLTLDGALV